MVRVTSLYSRIDRKATAANAEAVLMDYQHHYARVISWSMDLQSPNMDGMPRNPSVDNNAEIKITNRLSDEQFVKRCNNIVQRIENETYRNIIRFTYFRPLPTVRDIEERLALSPSTYRRQKQEALVLFAELWPPVPSELLVYKLPH